MSLSLCLDQSESIDHCDPLLVTHSLDSNIKGRIPLKVDGKGQIFDEVTFTLSLDQSHGDPLLTTHSHCDKRQ